MWIAADNKLVFRTVKRIDVLQSKSNDFNDIQAIAYDPEGYIWFANKNGLYKYNYLLPPDGNTQKISIPAINALHIVSLFLDDWGYLWIGTFDNGLYRLNTYNNEIRKFGQAQGLKNANIVSIQGRNNKMWLATLGGITECTIIEDKLNPGNLSYQFDNRSTANSPGEIFVYDVFIDSKDRVWFGTDGKGLSCLDHGNYKSYAQFNNLSNVVVYSIAEDKKGNIWFGLFGEGTCRYDGKSFTYFTKKDGLSDDKVNVIVEDK